MVTIVGIRFKRAGKIYYFAPGSFDLQKGDHAIVETARVLNMGKWSWGPRKSMKRASYLP